MYFFNYVYILLVLLFTFCRLSTPYQKLWYNLMSFARAASCKSVLARRFQCTLQPMRAMAIDHHRSHWVLRQWATHGTPLPLQAHLYFIAPSPHPLYAAMNLSSSTWPRSFLFAAGACLGGAMAQQGTREDPSLVATSLLCRHASTADRGEHGRTDLHLHLSNAAARCKRPHRTSAGASLVLGPLCVRCAWLAAPWSTSPMRWDAVRATTLNSFIWIYTARAPRCLI